ncbi:hypothetical protein [Candidatus Finniella inopinata]|uniref:Uncharacterized protein n=1 Tax=Candidatus Finniella inopinata TaxID=1696036 RepID=A0A4Q7DGD0_9PROT|nr:hypothetical protein [Candidatus Finniella inopinata]RZI45340.1 hypothetical protein EQU50_07355 [Candidatus Finniella inopinata]
MAKLTALLTLIALMASCPPETAAEPANNSMMQKTQNDTRQSNSYFSKLFEVGNYIASSFQAVKVFVESAGPFKPDVSQHSPKESLVVPLAPQIAKKPQGAQILEMGMNVPVGQKFSLGAEIGISKYKNNIAQEVPQKRPSAGLRLKPDLYTVKVGLKYKI